MTPHMALIPNHGEPGGVAIEYRRVYQIIAFSPGRQCFPRAYDMNVERTSRRTGSTNTAPLISHRHETYRTRFGPYLVSTLGPWGGAQIALKRDVKSRVKAEWAPMGTETQKIPCPKILGHGVFCVPVAK